MKSKVDFYNKEIERIDKLLAKNETEDKNKISIVQKKNRSSIIENRLKAIEKLIQTEYSNLAIQEEEIRNTQTQIDALETDEPVLHWSKLISDKRLKLIGGNSCTKKVIKYKGAPYIDVKLSKSNGKFFDEIINYSDGIYQIKYKSEKGQDGLAKVEIFIKRKDLPDNAKIIKYLKENILAQFEEQIDKSNEQIKLYTAEKEYCNKAKEDLNKKSDDQELRSQKTKLMKKINEENEFLTRLNERDSKYADIFERSKTFISTSLNYFEMIEIIDETIQFDSNLIDEFLKYYTAYKGSVSKVENDTQSTLNVNASKEENYLAISLYCPISQYLMTDPYVSKCGHSFECAAVMEYMRSKSQQSQKPLCPICKQVISSIIPNNELKQIINNWHKQKISHDYQETSHESEIVINTEAEFQEEIQSKKKIEEEIKKLKVNLEMKEFMLKEIDLRIEKWIKKQKKAAKSEKQATPAIQQTQEDYLEPSPIKKIYPQPPQRPAPQLSTAAIPNSEVPENAVEQKILLPLAPPSLVPPPLQKQLTNESTSSFEESNTVGAGRELLKMVDTKNNKPLNKLEEDLRNAAKSKNQYQPANESDSSSNSSEYDYI